MKKLIIYILPALVCAACKKSLIDLYPNTTASTENFYKTSNDMVNAVTAVYSSLQSNGAGSTEFMFGDIPTDDAGAVSALCAQGQCDFDMYTSKATGSSNASVLANRWNDAFKGISRANIVLGRIDGVDMSDSLKSRLIAESKFLRGYFYFNLVKVFGAVPLVLQEITTPEEAYAYGRTPAADVFAQIQKDMDEAAGALPLTYPAAEAGRITKGAALGMLARVLLFQSKFAEAAPLLKSVIETQSPQLYDLLPSYADVFKAANGNNKEILFAIQYSSGGNGVGAGPTNNFQINNADQPTVDIYNAFEAGDGRRNAAIEIGNLVGNTFTSSYAIKYKDPNIVGATNDGNTDYPVLRYADVLLMYAECINETGTVNDALPYMNKVRQRAGLAALQTTDAATTATYVTGQSDLRDRILRERRVELCFEGLRFFDLTRTGKLVTVMNDFFKKYNISVTIDKHHQLFPVAQTQIDINPEKMTQNDGY